MSNFDQPIKTLKILSADVKSIAKYSVKVIRELVLCVNLNDKLLANIACAGNYLDEPAICFLKPERIIAGLDEIANIEVNTHENSVNVILKNRKDFSETFVKNIASSSVCGKSVNADLLLLLKASTVDIVQCWRRMGKSLFREDINRHNTIDMLGGCAIIQGKDLAETIILTTGRISSESSIRSGILVYRQSFLIPRLRPKQSSFCKRPILRLLVMSEAAE